MSRQNPERFEDYQNGIPHRDSVDSFRGSNDGSSGSSALDVSGETVESNSEEHRIRQRPSTAFRRLNSLAQVGGVNSIENFARSWTRAAAFPEVTPQQSYIIQDDLESQRDVTSHWTKGDGETIDGSLDPGNTKDSTSTEISSGTKLAQLENQTSSSRRLDPRLLRNDFTCLSSCAGESIPSNTPLLSSSTYGSYGTSYETLQSNHRPSMKNAGFLWKQQQNAASQNSGHIGPNEREPVLLKPVEQDGKIVLMVAGQSTLPQTIFNSTNVLIGIGVLSLPLGFKYAGWIFGMIFLFLSAIVTSYTAKLLAKCMDTDPSLITFADLALASYGEKARKATSLLFAIELIAACVGSIVLFSDTLEILIPSISSVGWKILCGIILIPLNFLPLRLLSFSSVVGIFSCFSILIIMFIDGFVKPDTPGSLRKPAKTHLFPQNWLTLPLSIGLFMSPWGGHSVFPNIYRDMRHPQKYNRAVKITFTFTYLLNCTTAAAGILMFGDGIMDEISGNMIYTPGYPRFLSILLPIFIAIIPVTKIPINCSPMMSTVEILTGLKLVTIPDPENRTFFSPRMRSLLKTLLRVVIIVLFVLISIVFPSFDSIIAFMGSALCFTASVILPVLFYLKIFDKQIGTREKLLCYSLIVVSSIMATAGTVSAFLPKSLIHAE